VSLKRAKLDGQIAAIELPPARSDRLRAFLRDKVKRGTLTRSTTHVGGGDVRSYMATMTSMLGLELQGALF
jgi:hypothetical protein